MAEWILSLVVGLVGSHPAFAALLMVVGILRVVMKPLMVLVHTIVENTPSKADDEIVKNVEQSPVYKGFLFVLDWLASVKLPLKK